MTRAVKRRSSGFPFQNRLHEPRDRGQCLLRLFLVRRMAAVRKLDELARPAHLARDRIKLRHRAVGVVLALDRHHRAMMPMNIL